MAAAERLSTEVPQDLSAFDSIPWGSVPASLALSGQRRLEARTYLTDGYGLRRRIEDGEAPFVTMTAIAQVWQPSRLKGYIVAPGNGLPFLSAGQVFEARPRVRKWIAAPMVPDADIRYVDKDMLLLSCSGEVGRVTSVYEEHDGVLITHDLLRVVPRDAEDHGWLYAYMKTPIFYAIARSAQYGHMIKHLEPEHVQAMPVVMPPEQARREVGRQVERALELRRKGRRLMREADALYDAQINPNNEQIDSSIWQTVPVSALAIGRRRLEAQYLRADIRHIERLVNDAASVRVDRVRDVTKSVRLENRFKRYFGDTGTTYRSASEIFDVNPPVTKRVHAGLISDAERYHLKPGELVMARSGQVYGLLGRTQIIPEQLKGVFGSDDLIRIDPNPDKIRSGYLQTVLSNEKYGRPLVVRNASGTSIPHLDPVDVREVPVPRLQPSIEAAIADLAERAVATLAEADRLESDAIDRAAHLVTEAAQLHGLT
jgi:type I restriction enzyme S subunit